MDNEIILRVWGLIILYSILQAWWSKLETHTPTRNTTTIEKVDAQMNQIRIKLKDGESYLLIFKEGLHISIFKNLLKKQWMLAIEAEKKDPIEVSVNNIDDFAFRTEDDFDDYFLTEIEGRIHEIQDEADEEATPILGE